MNEPRKSDGPVVPSKAANMSFWDLKKLVERVKGRDLAKENEEHGTTEFLPAEPAKQVDRTQRRTMAARVRAKLQQIKQELRKRLHQRVPEVGRWLKSVLSGH